jgi:hypothetical protein
MAVYMPTSTNDLTVCWPYQASLLASSEVRGALMATLKHYDIQHPVRLMRQGTLTISAQRKYMRQGMLQSKYDEPVRHMRQGVHTTSSVQQLSMMARYLLSVNPGDAPRELCLSLRNRYQVLL